MDRGAQRRVRQSKETLRWRSERCERADWHGARAFLRRIPEGDRTFFKEAVEDPEVVSRRGRSTRHGRWLAVDDGDVVGYVAVVPLHGWSSHVGEIRLIVDPAHRGEGVGTRARPARDPRGASETDLSKLVVEVLADQEFTIEMFRSLGFDPEALLTGHVRDRRGELLDLMILAHRDERRPDGVAAGGRAGERPV